MHADRHEPIEHDRNGLEVLGREECLRLLNQATLGRVAITVGALPAVLPINFRLVDGRIVFRTSGGTKLDAATRNAVVAFEVDDMEPVSHTGWSVMVTGVAREVTDAAELDALASANIPRWAPADGERVVEINTDMISGRRIGPAPWPVAIDTSGEPAIARTAVRDVVARST